MSSELWLIEYERIAEDYDAAIIAGDHPEDARDDAAARLRSLGFDPHEVQEHLQELGQ